ncbi:MULTISPECIES: TIGR03943 family putative permease subunit [unclassified Streptomyces]|uniref:TIGR03943 family putative permease subunit n=1 Tax=unclassified Streptomyces TaxID=2593676 RepID=UPI002E80A7B4|nr:TIGR03943 family protein [Streptomyces sp. NBC_00589]WTI35066.1 TIGR03943 family protein [Streptomyces sp. NBC_00775]WUB31260.1 TIGR03943 family protein [Streptomyces sp. NBC_00589]
MRRYGPALLLVVCGAAVLRISLFSELYLRYVQAGLRPYLVVSGVLLLVLGIVGAVVAMRVAKDDHAHEEHEEKNEGDEHGHDHSHGPRVAWLLTVPAAALLLFPPPALGSYSAEREAATYAAQGIGKFDALPKGDPVDLTLSQFNSRAIYDSGRTMKGRTIRMIGFVSKDDNGTWYLTRLLISCCAADARPDKVEIRGADTPSTDSWVSVTGTWVPKGKLGSDAAWPPVLDATDVKHIKQPDSPYEKR